MTKKKSDHSIEENRTINKKAYFWLVIVIDFFKNCILAKYLVPLRYLDVTFRFNIYIYTCELDLVLSYLQRLMIGLKIAKNV